MTRKIWVLLIIIAGFMFMPHAAAIDVEKGVVFLSEVGGGNITFGANVTTTGITWVGDQVRIADLVYDGSAWGDIGFRAPTTSTTMNITHIDETHIVIDTTQASATTYEVYLNTAEAPNVTGATSSNYASPTLSYNMAAAGTVTLDWVVSYILLDSYTEGNHTSTIGLTAVFPGSIPGVYRDALGQTFNSTTEAKIGSAIFYIQRVGSPTGDLHAALYAHTGTFGTTGRPTGALLALSDPVDIASLGVGLTLVTFNFTGANRTRLEANTQYGIGLQIMSGSITLTKRVGVSRDAAGPTHEGNAYSRDLTWSADAWDNIFYLYGIAESPVNLDAETDGFITQNKGEWLNVTVRDYNGWENLDNVTVKVDTNGDVNTFSLQWDQTTDVFSETIDADAICLLNATRSNRVTLNASAIELRFYFNMIGGEQGVGNVTVTSYDDEGFSDVDEYVGAFGFTTFNITSALWALINSVFASFGVIDWVGKTTTFIAAVVAHFADSLIGLATMINLQFQIIWAVFGWFTGWVTRIITTVLAIGTAMSNIMNGATGGFTNLWTSFNFSSWIDIVPVFLIVWWVQTVTRRAKTQGLFTVLNGDFNAFANIFAFFMTAFAAIIGYVEGKIGYLSNYLGL